MRFVQVAHPETSSNSRASRRAQIERHRAPTIHNTAHCLTIRPAPPKHTINQAALLPTSAETAPLQRAVGAIQCALKTRRAGRHATPHRSRSRNHTNLGQIMWRFQRTIDHVQPTLHYIEPSPKEHERGAGARQTRTQKSFKPNKVPPD